MFRKIVFKAKPLLSSNRTRSGVKEVSQMSPILTKTEAKNIILSAKQESKLTFDELSKRLGVNKVWLTSAIYGEQPFDEESALKTLELLGINEKENQEFKGLVNAMKRIPDIRGADHQSYANDPFISRLYEIVRVYGPTLRALATEECGNGIVSAIDCKLECDKYVDKTDSERVVLKIDGKFLKYKN